MRIKLCILGELLVNKINIIKKAMIITSFAFVIIMLVLPLATICINSLSKGVGFLWKSVTDRYVVSALLLSVKATVIAVIVNTFGGIIIAWTITKYNFRGKQALQTIVDIPLSISPVIAGLAFIMVFGRLGWAAPIIENINNNLGLDIKIVFAEPGVVIATVFVTFPLVFREIISLLDSKGNDEEAAAAILGSGTITIFRKITFPHIKWSVLYGMILCASRALGEFGAVNALSKTRGKTFNLPQEIDALYFSGTADSLISAYAASSILVVVTVIILIVREILENKVKEESKY